MLDGGQPMMRIIVRYEIVAGDFPALDRASDIVLDALYARDDVCDADIAVSMTEPSLDVWFAVPTGDAMDALVVGVQALRESFRAAALTAVGFQVAAGTMAVVGQADLHVEAVPA
ncbi:MAG: hypothetical protein ACRDZR_03620 [Acidimicrobiales bacterium]